MPIKRLKFTFGCLIPGILTAECTEKGAKVAKLLCRHSGAGQNLCFLTTAHSEEGTEDTEKGRTNFFNINLTAA
ncbi:hypothetical protein SAMN04488024_105220 [Pedobacter soli]|uniref:Uncharacterized protein n=1 Tax=Pedobacter soli TaxID=390242 RepID=A0A1G6U325_9SPHI|nr:hypothetical protein SAMN04488024_105220 [Pedobacter soli]